MSKVRDDLLRREGMADAAVLLVAHRVVPLNSAEDWGRLLGLDHAELVAAVDRFKAKGQRVAHPTGPTRPTHLSVVDGGKRRFAWFADSSAWVLAYLEEHGGAIVSPNGRGLTAELATILGITPNGALLVLNRMATEHMITRSITDKRTWWICRKGMEAPAAMWLLAAQSEASAVHA